ncbi:MAG: hypothetical protein HQM07_05020, partial [Zetaproteobacteria bacterium]|nr:hypothetical protein [Zetaproteobacteria bacterium]
DSVELLLGGSAFATPITATLSSTDIINGFVDMTVLAADLGADGSKSLSVQITDVAGNVGTASTAVTFTLDTTAPTLTVSSVGLSNDTGSSSSDLITKTASQTITGTLSGALATGDILYGSVDNGANWIDITNMVNGTAISWTGATLSGSSNIVFKIADVAGNGSSTTGSTAYVLDTTAVAAPIRIAAPDPVTVIFDFTAAGQGAVTSSDGNFTANSKSFNAYVDYNIVVKVEGSNTILSNAANFTPFTGATNLGLNDSILVIDGTTNTSAGLIAANGNAAAGVAGVVTTGNYYYGKTGSYYLTANANTNAGKAIYLGMQGLLQEAVSSLGVLANIPMSSKNYLSLWTGQVGIAAWRSAVDHRFATASQAFTGLPSAVTAWDVLNDRLMNASEAASSVPFRVYLPTTGSLASAGDSVELTLNNLSFSTPKTVTLTQSDINNGYIDFTITGSELGADGTKTLRATITDVAGNVSSATAVTNFTLDTTVPTIDTLSVSSDDTVNTNDTISAVGFSGTTTGVEDGQTITVVIGGVSATATVSGGAFSGTVDLTNVADSSSIAVTADVNDAAGNAATQFSSSIAKDVVAPTAASVISAVAQTAYINSAEVIGTAGVTGLLITPNGGTIDSVVIGAQPKTGGGITWGMTPTSYNAQTGVWSFDSTPYVDGPLAVEVTTSDAAGNTFTNTVYLTLDTAAPVAPTITNVTGATNATSAEAQAGAVTVTAELNATVTVIFTGANSATVTKTVTATGGPDAVALTAQDLLTLGDGAITVDATAVDAAGNTSPSATQGAFTLDTVIPNTPVLGVVTGADYATAIEAQDGAITVTGDAGTTLTVTFTGTNGTVTKTVTATGAAQTIALTSANLTTLGDGTISVDATAVDAAGNSSLAATQTSFVLDTGVPNAPALAIVAGANYATAAEATTSGAVTVTAENGTTITVTFTNGANSVSKTVTADGTAQAVTLTAGDLTTLGDGSIAVSSTTVDLAGNVSAAATPVSFILDTVNPGSATVLAGGDIYVNALEATTTAALTITAAAVGESVSSVTVSGGGVGPVNATLNGGTGKYEFDATLFTDGDLTVTINTVDLAGNTNSNTATVTLDTAVAGSPTVSVGADLYVNAAEATSTTAVSITPQGTDTVTSVTVLDSAFNSAIATLNSLTGNYEFDATGLVDGALRLVIGTQDVAGNTGNSVVQVTLDTTASTLTVGSVGLSNDTGSSSSDWITKTASQTITGTLSGALATGDILYGSVDNGANWTDITNMVNGTAISWTGATLSGSSNIVFKITDVAGNDSSSTGSTAYVLDTAVATISSVSVAAGTYKVGDTIAVTITAGGNETGLTLSTATFNGQTLSGITDNNDGTYSATYTVVAGDSNIADLGSVVTDLVFTDVAGNVGSSTTSTTLSGTSIDANGPAISTVAITSATGAQNSTLNAGDTVTATVTFDDTVTVNTTGGSPTLALNIGGTTVSATYVSGSGTSSLTFSYTILAAQTDANGISVDANSLALNSATITDAAGNNATITHALVADNGSYMVDTTAPTIASVAVAAGSYKVGDAIAVTITAGGNETGLTLSTATFNGQTLSSITDNNDGTYSATYTVVEGDADIASAGSVITNLVFTDAAGNASSATTSASLLSGSSIDANSPTIATLVVSTDDVVNTTDTITAVAFAGTTTGIEDGQTITVVIGGVQAQVLVSGNAFSGTVNLTGVVDSTSLAVTGDVTDAAGNSATQFTNNIVLDTVAPTVSSVSIAAGSYKVGDAITVTITAGGNETGLTLSTATFNGQTLSSITDNNDGTYSATYTVVEGDSDIASAGSIVTNLIFTDAAGNASTATTSANLLAGSSIDANSPTIATLVVSSDDVINASDTITAVAFSGTTTGIENGQTITVVIGGVQAQVQVSGNAFSGSVNLTGVADSISLAVTGDVSDAAGNSATQFTNNIVFDTVAPTAASVVSASAQTAYINITEVTATSGTTGLLITANGTGGETIQSVQVGGQPKAGGATWAPVAGVNAGSGIWTFDASLYVDGPISVDVTSTDAAGNTLVNTVYLTLDTVKPIAPTVSVLAASANSAAAQGGAVTVTGEVGSTMTITFTGNSTVTKTVTATGGPDLITLTANDLTRLGVTTITVDAYTVDLAGNQSLAATQGSFALDNVAPTAPVMAVVAGADQATAAEAIAGAVELTTEANATVVATFTGVNGNVTKTYTATGTDAISLSSADLAVLGNGSISVNATSTDVAGNTSTVSNTVSFVLDTVAPTAPTLAIVSGANYATSAEAQAGAITVTAVAGSTVNLTFSNGSNVVTLTHTATGGADTITLSSGNLATLTDGTILVQATVSDAAGNISAGATPVSFVLDTVVPGSGTALAGIDAYLNKVEATVAAALTVTSGTAGESVTGVTVTGTLNAGGSSTVTATLNGITGKYEFDATPFADGALTVAVATIDLAGNTGSNDVTITLDTTKPGNATALVGADAYVNAVEATTTTALTLTPEVGSTVTGVTIFDANFLSVSAALVGGTWQFDATGLADGALTLVIATVDTAGNAGSNPVSLTLDTLAPTATGTTETLAVGALTNVQSTEVGVAYLVDRTITVTSLADITGAADSAWNTVDITAANTPTALDTTGLASGNYVVYTTDAAGNLSMGTDQTVTIAPPVQATVLFDLTTGIDTLNGVAVTGAGAFNTNTDYTITIKVNSTNATLSMANITAWTGGANLGAGDTISFVGTNGTTADIKYAGGPPTSMYRFQGAGSLALAGSAVISGTGAFFYMVSLQASSGAMKRFYGSLSSSTAGLWTGAALFAQRPGGSGTGLLLVTV